MEIERKYLVNKKLWQEMNNEDGDYIVQGYITTDLNKTIRIRIWRSAAYMTIKGKTNNISREEIEFPIPLDKATEIIRKFAEGIIKKIRYTIQFKGKTWEVDEFMGENEGLLLAEIELGSENEPVELPQWIGKEVSYDNRYFNSMLMKNPFRHWPR